MQKRRLYLISQLFAAGFLLSSCGVISNLGSGFGSLGGGQSGGNVAVAASEDVLLADATAGSPPQAQSIVAPIPQRSGFLRRAPKTPESAVQVNKQIWAASLEVLNFLPIQSADPFTGVIITGYGTPPGGGRAYRATIFVQNATLDAQSLRLALQTRSGPASTATVNAVEDAILTRARQLQSGASGS